MYTYKLGGMLITDELYHDDLESMTFGRKDQNELRHSGIKGMSWGKRRFQNEDGSLTAAGRNRYGVGDPMKGVSAYSDTGGNGSSGVNYYRLSGGTGGSTRSATANQAPARLVGSNSGGRATTSVTTTQKVANTTNAGRKAADNLFGRIGNWASNAAKDVGNFATNTYNDASKAVTNAANTVGNTVKNVAQDVSDWYTGDKAGKEAQRYDNVVQNFERNGDQNINAGQDIISRGLKYPESAYDLESGQSMRDKTVIEGLDRRNLGYDQHDIARQYGQKADEAQAKYEAAPRQVINSAAENIGNAAKDVGRSIGEGVQKAGDWASNAASDVRDWGAGALDKGRQAFESLFGRSEPPVPTLSDPNPQIETETILRENIIPEQRITEQRVPEQRITEQRVPEQRITENRVEEQRMAEKQAPGGFNSRPLTKEENEIELKRVNDRLNNIDDYYDHLRANNNPQWSNFTKQDIIDLLTKDRDRYQNKINQQQEAERTRALSDKPDGVSDEYWRDYTFNGGTRDSYDREMNARKNSQNNQNGSVSRKEVVGTVDTSRPYHFTYDPASGQTIVVYDDEKRR